jgi:hypothetical protein
MSASRWSPKFLNPGIGISGRQAGIVENESRHRFSPENNAKDIRLGKAQLKRFYRFDAKELTPRSLMVAVTFRPFRHYRVSFASSLLPSYLLLITPSYDLSFPSVNQTYRFEQKLSPEDIDILDLTLPSVTCLGLS